MPAGVEPHVADLDDVGGIDVELGHRNPPQRGAYPGDQLPQSERLRDVVVGTDLQADDRVDLGVARRHHDDRDARPRAQLAAHVDARDLRQHDVEQHERGTRRVETLDRLRAVGRGLDQEPLALQRDREGVPVGLLVVDHENQGRIGHRSSVGIISEMPGSTMPRGAPLASGM